MFHTKQLPTMQLIKCGPVLAVQSPEASISAANAKLSPIAMPKAYGDLHWPMMQVSCNFSAGVTKTDAVVIHARDKDTGQWHALAVISCEDAAVVTTTDGQSEQFEMRAGSDAIAVQHTLGNPADRPSVTIRPCAYVQVPVGTV